MSYNLFIKTVIKPDIKYVHTNCHKICHKTCSYKTVIKYVLKSVIHGMPWHAILYPFRSFILY